MKRRPPISTLFPYPTLFRSRADPFGVRHGLQLRAVIAFAGPCPAGAACSICATVENARHQRITTAWTTSTRSRRTSAPPSFPPDRKSTRLNSSHSQISYAVFCLKKKKQTKYNTITLREKSNHYTPKTQKPYIQ